MLSLNLKRQVTQYLAELTHFDTDLSLCHVDVTDIEYKITFYAALHQLGNAVEDIFVFSVPRTLDLSDKQALYVYLRTVPQFMKYFH